MSKEIKEEMVPIVIDLGMARRGELNESSLDQFGSHIELMLKYMFGKNAMPSGFVRGTQREVNSFVKALNGEKNYISAYEKYGLNDPKTFSSKYSLDRAMRNFERETGIKWPIK